jgi:cell wall-associated NlpC family hydrolase
MRRLVIRPVILVSLLLASGAHASPPAGTDDMERLLADKGLLGQIEQVRQSVSHKASELVVNALGFLGVPYKRGGNNVETGFDCSGFVRAMYEQTVGLILPRKAEQQAAATEKIERRDLQPGDLVFFNTMRRAFSHVGIYVGEGKFIHSPRAGGEVRVEDMGVSYWNRRFDGARRVNTPASGAATAAPFTANTVQTSAEPSLSN